MFGVHRNVDEAHTGEAHLDKAHIDTAHMDIARGGMGEAREKLGKCTCSKRIEL